MSTIAILTDPNVGGTFLTWSIHYLAGHDRYFSAKKNSWQKLVHDPLTGINAHNFRPNQPRSLEEFNHVSTILDQTLPDKFHTLYFHNFPVAGNDSQSFNPSTQQAVCAIMKKTDRTIVLNKDPAHAFYHSKFEARQLTMVLGGRSHDFSNFLECHDHWVDFFFRDSLAEWKNLGLKEVWDQREFLALNLRPEKIINITENIDLTQPHFRLLTFHLLLTFDHTAKTLFEYLGIPIDNDRFDKWVDVYHRWRKLHIDRINFVFYFDTIIHSIIGGHDLDLDRFNLDIVQEAVIQNHFIYQHNLNFKTWQLTKFHNARQLHNLLETNTHSISG